MNCRVNTGWKIWRQMRPLLVVMIVFFPTILLAQSDSTSTGMIEFIPHGWTFEPLLAPTIEPRVGLVTHFNDNSLRLDIGNSIDLLRFNIPEAKDHLLTMGADFFTWTALRGVENFHFPVDAVDYLFGINFAYRNSRERLTFSSRFRISHISAHLVDGSYEKKTSLWRNDRLPKVYSREFFDLVLAMDFHWIRLYAGVQYLFHVDPPEIPKWSLQLGTEFVQERVFDLPLHLYCAYDFRLQSLARYAAIHSLQAGVKLGIWRGRGVKVFVVAYNGLSYHGEYYDLRSSYWGPGFTVDF